ncbi:hypothetical protein TRFO_27679 [Tritrichomonas foetus]|uniref:Uncharacterized protein n=1 Tax=Tritrichomonas foetus TaxID=1144522 RepID=A0A1J4K5R4_9EUKA|nr:hypothetical protein TRFO_27679 [Tritrichomonas foetus]|eukprot:OHT04813.1 hypothetical protein TRFO_27679 [Tritrichomonas foetus]
MGEIQTLYLNVLNKEKELADAEERTAEDINDIAARFEVIFRLSEETSVAKKKVKDAKARIEKLRKDLELDSLKGGTKKYKIEADINKAIDAKKQAIEAAEEKLQEFIAAKEKYTTFKVSRLQHAYNQLGKVITSSMREQSEEAEKLSQAISEAQENIDHLLETEAPASEPAEPVADDY